MIFQYEIYCPSLPSVPASEALSMIAMLSSAEQTLPSHLHLIFKGNKTMHWHWENIPTKAPSN